MAAGMIFFSRSIKEKKNPRGETKLDRIQRQVP
jgi:hypothetical protein